MQSLLLERLEDRTLLSLLSTDTVLTASVASPLYGQVETLTATVAPVSPGYGTPTGTITFYDGTTELAAMSLVTSGGVATAALTETTLAVGSHSITAVYAGDPNFLGSRSQIISQVAGVSAGLALDAHGNLFTVNGSGLVCVAPDGVVTTISIPGFIEGDTINGIIGGVTGLAVDAQGDLFMASPDFALVLEAMPGPDGLLADGTVTTIAGGGTNGDLDFSGPAKGARLDWPSDVALNAHGDLFIADTFGHRIREVIPGPDGLLSDGTISTVAGTGGFAPQPGSYSGDGGSATAAHLNYPNGIVVDSQGDLLIADTSNNVVRELVPGPDGLFSDATIATVIGTGAAGYTGDGGPAPAGAATLNAPLGLALQCARRPVHCRQCEQCDSRGDARARWSTI